MKDADCPNDQPRYFKRAVKPRQKKYGIEYFSQWFQRWEHWKWYATGHQRDQALADLERHTSNILKDRPKELRYRKVNR